MCESIALREKINRLSNNNKLIITVSSSPTPPTPSKEVPTPSLTDDISESSDLVSDINDIPSDKSVPTKAEEVVPEQEDHELQLYNQRNEQIQRYQGQQLQNQRQETKQVVEREETVIRETIEVDRTPTVCPHDHGGGFDRLVVAIEKYLDR